MAIGWVKPRKDAMRKTNLLTVFLIVFIDLVGFGIVLPNLQLYGQQFGISNYFYLTLIGVTYSFFQFLFAPILGRWSDHIGRRPVLIISQVGTIIGFLMLFSADFFPMSALGIALIFISRMIDGISGGNISTANAYVADITTPENRAKGMGVIGAAFGLGFVFGPVIGGTVSWVLGLQWVPLVAAAFSLVALLLTIFTLGESRTPNAASNDAAKRRFSLRGLERALARPIIGPLILLFFLNGFAFAGMEQTLSLLIQHRLYPLQPTSQTSLPPAAAANPRRHQVPAALAAPMPSTAAFRTLQDDKASRASGYLFGVIGIVIVLIQGGMIGRLTKKYGETALAIVGPLIIAAGMVLIAVPVHWAWAWTGFLAGGVCLALGSGLYTPAMQSMISRHAAAEDQGEILGANQGMASLARATGPILAGLLFEYVMPASPYYVSAVFSVIVALAIFMGRKRFRPPAPIAATESSPASA
jgi:MFS family permease